MGIGIGLGLGINRLARLLPAGPSIASMPSGVIALFDPASLAGVGNGGTVLTMTDTVNGIVANSRGGATPNTFVANSGGLPALRLNGGDELLMAAGSNAVVTQTSNASQEWTMIVVARNVLDSGGAPCLAQIGTGFGTMFQANSTQTGFFGGMRACSDPVRTIALTSSPSHNAGLAGINGTCIALGGPTNTDGSLSIGGWHSNSSQNDAKADVLGVILWNRALSAAEIKQVHKRYLQLLGLSYPTGRNVTVYGDSICAGAYSTQNPAELSSLAFRLASALNLPWGTWDQLAVSGFTPNDILTRTVAMSGNIAAVTGSRTINVFWEWANARNSDPTGAGYQGPVLTGLRQIDSACDLVFGTSVDFGYSDAGHTNSSYEDLRDAYNAFWDNSANRATYGLNGYVPIHQNQYIGIRGAAPSVNGGNAYYVDDHTDTGGTGSIHLNDAGHAVLESLFQPVVAARLAA